MTAVKVPVLTTSADLDSILAASRQPVMLLLWHDKSPRRDVEIALQEAVDKHGSNLSAYQVDARQDPAIVARFGLGSNPVLLGWYDGEERLRRSKPWNTDVPFMAADLIALIPEDEMAEEPAEDALANGVPIHVTAKDFMEKVINSPLPVLVDFWAEWCEPCKSIAPVLEKLAKEYAGRVRIAKVDVDKNQQLAGQFGIQSIPTLMFVKNGQIVGQSAGAAPEAALRQVMDQLIALEM